MKNIFGIVLAAMILISCGKTDFQKTTDSIKSADSLIQQANDGFKTLDSISKIVNDTAKFRKIVVPEIEKHTKEAEKIIRDNNINLDSLNKEIKKVADKIGKSTDVIKSVDSVSKALNESKNPIDKIATVTDAINKVVKKNSSDKKSENQPSKEVENSSKPLTPPTSANTKAINPMGKILKLEISVENADDARNQLSRLVKNYGGEITGESFGAEEGIKKQLVNAKIPYQYFEEVSQNLFQNLGTVQNKTVDSYGTDYDPNQKCDLIITFKEKNQSLGNSTSLEEEKTEDKFSEKSSNAFMKGFDVLGSVFLFLLPFWPLFLLALIGFLIYRRSKRKKQEKENSQSENKENFNR